MANNEFNPLEFAASAAPQSSNGKDAQRDPEQVRQVEAEPAVEPPAPTSAGPTNAAPAAAAATNTAPARTAAGKDVYAQRRTRALTVGALAVVALGWFLMYGIPGAAPSQTEQKAAGKTSESIESRNATADSITARVNNDLTAAEAHYESNGSLDGFQIRGNDARIAAAGRTLVASRLVDDTCFMYGWTEYEPQAAVVDSTGEACTDAAIATAQAELNEQAEATERALAESADDAFTAAATGVRQYGLSNWVDGQPSLSGIPEDLGRGVTVVENQVSYVVAQAVNGNACQEASIGADGTVGEPLPCP